MPTPNFNAANLITGQAANRLNAAADKIEQAAASNQRRQGGGMPPVIQFARCTSDTPTAKLLDSDSSNTLYPGKILIFDTGAGSFIEFGDCWLKAPHDEPLDNGADYPVRISGVRQADNRPVCITLQAGIGSVASMGSGGGGALSRRLICVSIIAIPGGSGGSTGSGGTSGLSSGPGGSTP